MNNFIIAYKKFALITCVPVVKNLDIRQGKNPEWQKISKPEKLDQLKTYDLSPDLFPLSSLSDLLGNFV